MYGWGATADVVQPTVLNCAWGEQMAGDHCERTARSTALSVFGLPAILLNKVAPSALAHDDMGIGGFVISAGAWAAVGLWLLFGGKR